MVPAPDGFSVTELELAISDGKTSKTITCDGPNVTARHEQIMEALGAAAE